MRVIFMAGLFALVVSIAGGVAVAGTDSIEIKLDRCTLNWTVNDGLSLNYDGIRLLDGTESYVVTYPPGWAWSYHPDKSKYLDTKLETAGDQKILTITCDDPKLSYWQTITAGPGDRFKMEFAFTQNAWDEAMMSEVCLCRPVAGWFAGSQYRVDGPDGLREDQIPLQYDVPHPFSNVTDLELYGLFGKLSIKASKPLTLYDYADRHGYWLGRDADLARGVEDSWFAEIALEPQAFEVGGLKLQSLKIPEKILGETLVADISVARLVDGPEKVTANLIVKQSAEETSTVQELALTTDYNDFQLPLTLPKSGQYEAKIILTADGKELWTSPSFIMNVPKLLSLQSGLSYYLTGQKAALLVDISPELAGDVLLVIDGDKRIFEGNVKPGQRMQIPLETLLADGEHKFQGTLYQGNERLGGETCTISVYSPKANAIQIDNRSKALIRPAADVNEPGLPIIPRSFYADWNSVRLAIEDEANQGFNMVCCYLDGDIELRVTQREELRALLDRCAEIGLMVHLDIRTASRAPHTKAKWAWLKEEIEAFKDHPALATWYLADEPELGWATPEDCEIGYQKIQQLDPYHPITMVFCQSAAAAQYANGMDLIMTDPYPIPHAPVTNVSDFCDWIIRDTRNELPLWIVPQAFGGGEWWKREPSQQEMRTMVYLALIHGCRGVQYFIRRPHIANPTSPDLWNECRRLMLEVSQLEPALSSGLEAPKVTCDQPSVHFNALYENGAVTILATNVLNKPLNLNLKIENTFTGDAEVMFENRFVEVTNGIWTDTIEGMGSRVWRLQVDSPKPDIAILSPDNLLFNGGFEQSHNTGTPDGAYLGVKDRGASWYVDPRLSVEGRQSLRLTTPKDNQGIAVIPFAVTLEPNTKYRLSIWAKGERTGQKFIFSIANHRDAAATHELGTDWKQYQVEFTTEESVGRISAHLQLLTAGNAWFDAMELIKLQ